MPTPYPLAWPVGRPRRKWRYSSKFRTMPDGQRHRARFPTAAEGRDDVLEELRKWGVETGCVISCNATLGDRNPQDPAAAVYFRDPNTRKDYAVACDTWDNLGCNLRAIAKTLEALRMIDRYGVTTGTQIISAFLALPERGDGPRWWEVLEVPETATREQVREARNRLAKIHHPDAGGTADAWQTIAAAYLQADAHFTAQSIVL